MKSTLPDTKTVRGREAEEVLAIARRIVRRSPLGILAQFDPSGYHRVLWAGEARVAAEGTVRTDEPLDASHFLHITEVLWAFTADDGASVRIYGELALRLEQPKPVVHADRIPFGRVGDFPHTSITPAPDRREWPLALVTEAHAVRVDVPGHGISVFGLLPARLSRKDATGSSWLFGRG